VLLTFLRWAIALVDPGSRIRALSSILGTNIMLHSAADTNIMPTLIVLSDLAAGIVLTGLVSPDALFLLLAVLTVLTGLISLTVLTDLAVLTVVELNSPI